MTSRLQANSLKAILKKCLALLDPPPAFKVWEWGESRRRMGKNVTAKPGRYSVANTPYMKEPQESFNDPAVQTTVLYMGKRLGKTEGAMNLIGATIEQNPRNILVVYPTLDSAKKWSKQFFSPMVKSTPALRRLIRDGRTKDANNTILAKEFPGGTISAIGSNSPSGFRQVQAPVIFCDEVDAMVDTPEGDPVTLAFGRAENFPDSVQVVSSTATKLFRKPEDTGEGQTTGSRIHDWYLKSDQRKWFVPCPCGQWHVLAWANVKWDKNEDGTHKLETAYYETPCCGQKWDDEARERAILAGEWRPTAPFNGVRGYHLNGLNSTFSAKKGYKSKLHQMAGEFYDAYRSGEAARIAWKNTFLCEPHIEDSEKVDPNPLYERQEDYTPQALPEGILVIGLVMDVQGDRLEYEFVGMGEGEETWGIEYGKLMGDPEKEAVWEQAKQLTARTFNRVDGVQLKVACVACDHRHKGSRVRKFIQTCGHPRAYAVYGSASKQGLLVVPHRNKHYRMNLYSVNTDSAKDTIFARLRLKEMGARYMHFPKGHGYDKQSNGYFDQLTAEESRITYKRGYPERHYEKIRDRNEALDLRVYFLAAMDILRPALSVVAKNIKATVSPTVDYVIKPVETAQPQAKPQPKQPQKPERFSYRRKF